MLTFVLLYLDAHNMIGAPGVGWYFGSVIVDLLAITIFEAK